MLDDTALRYYTELNGQLKGEILVSTITSAEKVDPGAQVAADASTTAPKKPVGPFCLKITTQVKGTRTFYFLASSRDEQIKWIKALLPNRDDGKGERVQCPYAGFRSHGSLMPMSRAAHPCCRSCSLPSRTACAARPP